MKTETKIGVGAGVAAAGASAATITGRFAAIGGLVGGGMAAYGITKLAKNTKQRNKKNILYNY